MGLMKPRFGEPAGPSLRLLGVLHEESAADVPGETFRLFVSREKERQKMKSTIAGSIVLGLTLALASTLRGSFGPNPTPVSVPEPSTWAYLGLYAIGAGGVGLYLLRRKL
jgi:hypothetical protein